METVTFEVFEVSVDLCVPKRLKDFDFREIRDVSMCPVFL